MAQNGGGVSSARIVATQPTRPAARTHPLPPSSAAQRDFISLVQPRPGLTRKQNEYIETPLRPQLPSSKTGKLRLKDENGILVPSVAASSSEAPSAAPGLALPGVHRPYGRGGTARSSAGLFNTQLPVTAQPTVATFKKEKLADTVSDGSDVAEDHGDSIICRQCGRCKCESCRNPRPLPSTWICNDKYLCSALSVVDYCSCLCCVKGLFYHWAKDYEMDNDVSCADQPCSCGPHKRCLRWGCLGVLSLVLPCLCCYWPLRGCVKLCEKCYSECSGHGCRCSQRRTAMPAEQNPDKRLLDSNSDC